MIPERYSLTNNGVPSVERWYRTYLSIYECIYAKYNDNTAVNNSLKNALSNIESIIRDNPSEALFSFYDEMRNNTHIAARLGRVDVAVDKKMKADFFYRKFILDEEIDRQFEKLVFSGNAKPKKENSDNSDYRVAVEIGSLYNHYLKFYSKYADRPVGSSESEKIEEFEDRINSRPFGEKIAYYFFLLNLAGGRHGQKRADDAIAIGLKAERFRKQFIEKSENGRVDISMLLGQE